MDYETRHNTDSNNGAAAAAQPSSAEFTVKANKQDKDSAAATEGSEPASGIVRNEASAEVNIESKSLSGVGSVECSKNVQTDRGVDNSGEPGPAPETSQQKDVSAEASSNRAVDAEGKGSKQTVAATNLRNDTAAAIVATSSLPSRSLKRASAPVPKTQQLQIIDNRHAKSASIAHLSEARHAKKRQTRQRYFQRREYISKKKLRIPSWCDRVLHRTMPGGWVYFVR